VDSVNPCIIEVTQIVTSHDASLFMLYIENANIS